MALGVTVDGFETRATLIGLDDMRFSVGTMEP